MFSITNRGAHLGTAIAGKKRSEDGNSRLEAELTGILLSTEEVNAMLEDPYADRCLFNEKDGVKQPALPDIQHSWTRKMHGARVTITLSTPRKATEVNLVDCDLKDFVLEPQQGGDTALSLKVACIGDYVPSAVGHLTAHLGGSVMVEIVDAELAAKRGADNQQQLPLNTFGADKPAETNGASNVTPLTGRKRTGRKPRGLPPDPAPEPSPAA
jgi:hypothetical protein